MAEYPYLAVSLALFLIAALLVLVAGEHRRLLLVSGALAAPLALFSWQFIPEYWNPRVLFRFVTSLEDIVFSASMGVIVVALTLVPFRDRVQATLDWTAVLRRYAICVSLFAGIHELLLYTVFTPAQVMYSCTIAVVVLTVFLSSVRRDTLPVAIVGVTVFPVFYFVVMTASFAVFPAAVDYWVPVAQLPVEVRGMPAFELVWAAGWGITWPAFVWYACGVKSRLPALIDRASDRKRPVLVRYLSLK